MLPTLIFKARAREDGRGKGASKGKKFLGDSCWLQSSAEERRDGSYVWRRGDASDCALGAVRSWEMRRSIRALLVKLTPELPRFA